MANLFRLFYLFIGCNKVGHMTRVTWNAEGVRFSAINRSHLQKEEFKDLLRSTDIIKDLIDFIKGKTSRNFFVLNTENFTTDRAIKAFLTLKVFYAIGKDEVLAFYDGNKSDTGVAIYKKPNDNKLLNEAEFSLENMMCGFGVKAGGGGSYIHYTNNKNWLQPDIIDAPFAGLEFKEDKRTDSQLDINKQEIEKVLKLIFDEQNKL